MKRHDRHAPRCEALEECFEEQRRNERIERRLHIEGRFVQQDDAPREIGPLKRLGHGSAAPLGEIALLAAA